MLNELNRGPRVRCAFGNVSFLILLTAILETVEITSPLPLPGHIYSPFRYRLCIMELKIHQLRAQFVKSDMPGGIVQRTKGLNKLKSKNPIVKPDQK